MSDSAKPLRLSRNLISEAGIGIAVVALANLGFLIYLDATRANSNPYMGILTWIIAPAILIVGFLIFFAGMLIERRRPRKLAPARALRARPAASLRRAKSPNIRRSISMNGARASS